MSFEERKIQMMKTILFEKGKKLEEEKKEILGKFYIDFEKESLNKTIPPIILKTPQLNEESIIKTKNKQTKKHVEKKESELESNNDDWKEKSIKKILKKKKIESDESSCDSNEKIPIKNKKVLRKKEIESDESSSNDEKRPIKNKKKLRKKEIESDESSSNDERRPIKNKKISRKKKIESDESNYDSWEGKGKVPSNTNSYYEQIDDKSEEINTEESEEVESETNKESEEVESETNKESEEVESETNKESEEIEEYLSFSSEKESKKRKKSDSDTNKTKKKKKYVKESSDDEDTEYEINEIIKKKLTKEELTKNAESITKIAESLLVSEERNKKEKEIKKIEERTKINEENSIVNISRKEGEIPVYFNKEMMNLLMPHQKEGIQFLWKVIVEIENKKGGILAHSMGLGKTAQAICFHCLLSEIKYIKKTLIVCPSNVISTWKKEFNKWCENFKYKIPNIFIILKNNKTKNKRKEIIKEWYENNNSVIVIGYSLFRSLINSDIEYGEYLLNTDLIIVDEGHKIKKNNSQTSKTLEKINTKNRIILTGTPLQNNLIEYWTMLNFVQEGLWTKSEFKSFFEYPITQGNKIDSTELEKAIAKKRMFLLTTKMSQFVHRRDQNILKKYLPEKKEYILYLSLTNIQKNLYNNYINHISKSDDKFNFLSSYNLLLKIISHPIILKNFLIKKKELNNDNIIDVINVENNEEEQIDLDKNWIQKEFDNKEIEMNLLFSNKMKITIDIINSCIINKKKLILFTQYIQTLDILENFITSYTFDTKKTLKKDVNYFKYSGKTESKYKDEYINKFNNNNESILFLASTKATSLGIDLSSAEIVIFFDLSWNPVDNIQSISRSYRLGQKKQVTVIMLISKDTIEENILNSCIEKTWLFQNVVDKENTKIDKNKKSHIFNKIPKEKYEPKINYNLYKNNVILNDIINTNKSNILEIVNNESIYSEDSELISEIDKQNALEEYNNRNKIEKKPDIINDSPPISSTSYNKSLSTKIITNPILNNGVPYKKILPKDFSYIFTELDSINLLKIHNMNKNNQKTIILNQSLTSPSKQKASYKKKTKKQKEEDKEIIDALYK